MINTHSYWKSAVLSIAMAAGMAMLSVPAQAHGYSRASASVRSAQQQLKNAGYYTGAVDGVDGPMTRAAIRKYQRENNLAVNGRLDRETRNTLGAGTSGEASRSESGAVLAPSSATVSAAQRSLQQKGFYKGNIDGNMGPRTRSAIREYQKNSNLNVTGRLDAATLSSLGVSK